MKKSLIFWFAAATCAAWILVGCEQEAETKTVTVTNGAAGDIPGLNKLLDEGVSPIRYVGDLAIGTNTVVIPAGITVNVDGGVTLGSDGKFIVVGNLSLGAGKGIVVTAPGGTVVGSAAVTDKVTGAGAVTGSVAGTVAEATAAFTTESVVLVTGAVGGEALTLAAVPSGKTLYVANTLTLAAVPAPSGSVIPLGTVSVTAATLDLSSIVDNTPANGKLTLSGATLTTTVAATVTLPATATVKAINAAAGKLTVAGATSLTVVGDLTGDLALTAAVTAVTINGGAGNVEFTVATGALTALSLENTGTIAFNHAAAALSIPDDVQAVFGGDVTLAGGISTGAASSTSKITFNGNVTLGEGKAITIAESETASAVTLKAGKSIYAGAAKLITAAKDTAFTAAVDGAVLTFTAASGLALSTQGVVFGGDVVFYGDLTLTAVPATFGGTAYFQNAKKITLTAAESVITLTASTGALAQGDPAADVPAAFYQILVGGTGNGTLTPSASTTLTFATGRIVEQSGTTTTHKIELGSKAAVVAGATYKVASANGNVGTLSLASGAELTLAEGVLAGEHTPAVAAAKLILTGATGSNGAILANAGKVVAGGTEITGGNASGTWTAGGAAGTVTIEADKITGSAPSVALTAGGHADAAITVAAEETLTVDGVAVTVVSSYGKVVLAGDSEGGGSLLLKGGAAPGKLDLGNTGATNVTIGSNTTNANFLIIPTGGSDATNAKVTKADGTAIATSTGIVVKAAAQDASSGSLLDYIAGGSTADTTDVLISGPSTADDSTIINTHQVKVPNT